MKRVQKHLHEPVEVGCRQLAAALLETAAGNAARLEDPEDRDALHDFRVGIRRLVSFLQAYQPYLRHQGYGVLRKRLAALIAATNAGRDNEVHVLWLKKQLKNRRLPRLQRQGLELVLDAMEAGKVEVDMKARATVLRRFQKVRRKLDSRLTRRLESVRVNEDGEVITFGVATGAILAVRADALRQRLQRVTSIEQLKRAHRARLAAKRLRYVLDPVRSLVPGGLDAVSRLKGLQDVLGDLRDLQTLEAPLGALVEQAMDEWSRSVVDAAMQEGQVAAITKSTPAEDGARATAAAVQRVRSEQRRLFGVFEERWLGGHADPFFVRMERISTFLNPSLASPPEPEQDSPVPEETTPVVESTENPTDAPPPRPIQNVNWVFARQPDPPMPRKRGVRPSGRKPQQAGD